MDLDGENEVIIVAEDDRHKPPCRTNAIKYIREQVKHAYGVGDKKPLEEWFFYELR